MIFTFYINSNTVWSSRPACPPGFTAYHPTQSVHQALLHIIPPSLSTRLYCISSHHNLSTRLYCISSHPACPPGFTAYHPAQLVHQALLHIIPPSLSTRLYSISSHHNLSTRLYCMSSHHNLSTRLYCISSHPVCPPGFTAYHPTITCPPGFTGYHPTQPVHQALQHIIPPSLSTRLYSISSHPACPPGFTAYHPTITCPPGFTAYHPTQPVHQALLHIIPP